MSSRVLLLPARRDAGGHGNLSVRGHPPIRMDLCLVKGFRMQRCGEPLSDTVLPTNEVVKRIRQVAGTAGPGRGAGRGGEGLVQPAASLSSHGGGGCVIGDTTTEARLSLH